jgi:hypothetical protein
MPSLTVVPCLGFRCNEPRSCRRSLLENVNVLSPPGLNVTNPRFGGFVSGIAGMAWRACSPTVAKARRAVRSRFPPCNGHKSLNSPVWNRSPRGCISRTGPARIWPVKRWKTRSSLPSARQRFAAFCTTSICNPIGLGIGRRLGWTPGSRRERSKSFGVMPMRLGLRNGASGLLPKNWSSRNGSLWVG